MYLVFHSYETDHSDAIEHIQFRILGIDLDLAYNGGSYGRIC